MTNLEFHLTLNNRKDLVFSKKSKFIYDENDHVIGHETRVTPKGLIHNPLDDIGKQVMIGTDIDNDSENIFILEFKDMTMKFVNGKLVE